MYLRLQNYLIINYVIADNQYGFRARHSTCVALLRIINDITYNFANKNVSIRIFVDLSEAFDIFDYSLLIKNYITMV